MEAVPVKYYKNQQLFFNFHQSLCCTVLVAAILIFVNYDTSNFLRTLVPSFLLLFQNQK